MVLPTNIRSNQSLAALPSELLKAWSANLKYVEMPLGHVLYEAGDRMSNVYFPTTAIVSLLYVMEDGTSAEIAVVGHEGIVGVSVFMGGESTTSRAVVQSAGHGYSLKSSLLMGKFNLAGRCCIFFCTTPRH